jgi:hypothetical protein
VGVAAHPPAPRAAADPLQAGPRAVARQAGPVRVEGQVVGVRPVEPAARRALDERDRRRAPPHQAAVRRAAQLVVAAAEAVPAVEAAGVGGRAQEVQLPGAVEVAVGGRQDPADGAAAALEVAGHARDGVVGQRLHRAAVLHPRLVQVAPLLGGGQRVHQPDRPPRGGLPRELEGAQDGGRLGRAAEARAGRHPPLWRAPDPPRVEELRPRDLEDVRALGEEGALLLELRLEGRQVDLGGVRLHLAEVRVQGGGERQVRRQPVLQVGAEGAEEVVRAVEGVAVLSRRDRRGGAREPCDGVGLQLQPARRPQVAQPLQPPEPGDDPRRLRRDR